MSTKIKKKLLTNFKRHLNFRRNITNQNLYLKNYINKPINGLFAFLQFGNVLNGSPEDKILEIDTVSQNKLSII